jgi:hypothetical protein
MKSKYKLLFSLIMLVIIILPSYSSINIEKISYKKSFSLLNLIDDKQIYLLRVEHYLELQTNADVNDFCVKYACPTDYNYQTPIVVEILDNSSDNIIDYKIENDVDGLNKIVNFSISSMNTNQNCMIHFTIWGLVESFDFNDVPDDVSIPSSKYEVPEDTRIWLSSSDVVQSRRLLIRRTANELQGRDDDVLSYAKNVSHFIKNHRYLLFVLQLRLGVFFKQDAMTTLFINGENVGRAHLACALFRNKNIPARVILVNNDQGFPTQMHYMVEYYVPDYGWVLLDTTRGETPYDTHRQLINRICFIADEDDTKTDYIFRFMKGEERWIWISNDNVTPKYIDCETASRSQMFTESILDLNSFVSDYMFFRTQNVFSQYQKYLGMDLSSENQGYLENAIAFQIQAVHSLNDTEDVNEYVYFIEKAFDEYKKINL